MLLVVANIMNSACKVSATCASNLELLQGLSALAPHKGGPIILEPLLRKVPARIFDKGLEFLSLRLFGLGIW